MASADAIAAALLARAETLSVGSPALRVAHPDIAFTPANGETYLEVSIFYNRPAWEGLKVGRLDQGLLQVTIVGPKGAGVPRLMRLAQEVVDHFPKGLTLTGRVRVSAQPYATSPLLEASDTRVPVTIPWAA